MNGHDSRLWLAIRLADLSLTALNLEGVCTKPTVISEKKRVVFANTMAEDAGVQLGMEATTAHLLCGCDIVERDTLSEQRALRQLCDQLYQFTPHIECYYSSGTAQSGLLLEISSCLKLFSGLTSLTDKVAKLLEQTPYCVDFGLAHSAKAAWLLSFEHHQFTGQETKSLFVSRLNALPIDLLFDYPQALEALKKTGFTTFGDVARQIEERSIRSFRKRLGQAFADALCEIYGIDQNFMQQALFEKPRDSYCPEEWFEEEIHFDYPVTFVDQLKSPLELLLVQLSDYLRQRQQQCQYFEWCISDIYHRKELIKINTDTPQSHWQLLYDLSLIQFEQQELPFEVDTLKLTCRHAIPLPNRSLALDFEHNRRRKSSVQDFAVTIAKLKARLGDAAVYKLSYVDHRVPEVTQAMVALTEQCQQELPDVHLHGLRPTWLLSTPELIENRDQRLYWHGYLSLLVGPERIIGDWWREPVARDYYLAKRHDNLPVWIFRNLYDKQWYVHGVFS